MNPADGSAVVLGSLDQIATLLTFVPREAVIVADSVVPPLSGRVVLVVSSPGTLAVLLRKTDINPVRLYMPTPTMAELRSLRDAAFSEMKDWQLARRVYFWGPIPRYIFSADADFLRSTLRGVHASCLGQVAAALLHIYTEVNGSGVADDVPHRLLLVRAALEDPRRQRTGDSEDVMQLDRVSFTSRPWLEQALYWDSIQDLTTTGSVVGAALGAPLPTKLRGVIYENNVKKLLSQKDIHTFRIRRLGVEDAVEEEVSLIGGIPAEWYTREEVAPLVAANLATGCAPLFPFNENEATVDMLCCFSRNEAWEERGFNGKYVAMNCTLGKTHDINSGGLQFVATALGWYDKNDQSALLDKAILDSLQSYDDKSCTPDKLRDKNAAIRVEFARMRAAGVPIDPLYDAVESAIAMEAAADIATRDEKKHKYRGPKGEVLQSTLDDATNNVRPCLVAAAAAAAKAAAAATAAVAVGATAPAGGAGAAAAAAGGRGGRSQFPFVFVVDPAMYASPEWRRSQIFKGAVAGHLQESVVQYVMEVDTRRMVRSAVTPLAAEFLQAAQRWTIDTTGDPIPPDDVVLPRTMYPSADAATAASRAVNAAAAAAVAAGASPVSSAARGADWPALNLLGTTSSSARQPGQPLPAPDAGCGGGGGGGGGLGR